MSAGGLCGQPWPDEPAPDGRPVTCHLDKGHGGLWHYWWHELHVAPGEPFGDGSIGWHTDLGLALIGDKELTPSLVKLEVPYPGPDGFMVTHAVVPHPVHVTLRENLPDKPAR